MALLGWLDPTSDWPIVPGAAPDLDGPTLQLTALPFGQPLESARVLGRPEALEWRSRMRKDVDLLYASKGLRLEFERGLLTVLTYLIGARASGHPAFAPARPLAPNGMRLGPDLDRGRIVSLFGEPDAKGSDETCLQVFHRCGVISDFFLDEQGRLTEWALYPDD